MLQSQERLQTKVAKLEAQTRPLRTTTAPATRPALLDKGQRPPQGVVHEPGASWTQTENLAVLGAAASATCAESAANLRWTSGRFTGWRSVHWGSDRHRGLLYAPTTGHFSQTGGACSSPQAAG